MGAQIEENNTGYIIEERKFALSELMKLISTAKTINEYKVKSENCHRLWVERYKDYFKKTLVGEYINQCKRLIRE